MNDQDYHTLLDGSEAFASLDDGLKADIQAAQGPDRERYAAVMLREKKDEADSLQSLKRDIVDTVRNFDTACEKDKKELLQYAELTERDDDEQKAENLLNNL